MRVSGHTKAAHRKAQPRMQYEVHGTSHLTGVRAHTRERSHGRRNLVA
jgi:hypothetical protein